MTLNHAKLLKNLLFQLDALYENNIAPAIPKILAQYSDEKDRQSAAANMKNQLYNLKYLINSYKKLSNVPENMSADGINNLVGLANSFDNFGDYKTANMIDGFINKVCTYSPTELIEFADYFDKQGAYALADKAEREAKNLLKLAYIPVMRAEDGAISEENSTFVPMNEGSLSTRYCPDHRGIQSIRLAENMYQCPIDGKTYNYSTGYVNYQGQQVPGGSVAAQTPSTTNYGGIPLRIYDNRETVLRTIH